MWFRIGSVRFRFLVFCYRPGSVYVRFRFLWFLVDFGSARCLELSALTFAFFPGSEKQIPIELLPARGLLLPGRGFMSSSFQRAAELMNSENQSFLKL